MPGLQTTTTLAALKTRLFKDFGTFLNAPSVVQTSKLGLYTEVPSDTALNTYDWLASQTGMREWYGPRIVEGWKERSFQIANRHFEKTLEINRDTLDDSPMSAIADASMRMSIAVEGARKLEDDLMFNPAVSAPMSMGNFGGLLAAATTTVCYDGQYFFDTDHPTDLDGTGTQSNYEATSFALSTANFMTARARMMAFKGENGRPLNVNPNLLVVPPALEKTARETVIAEFNSTGATNVARGLAEVMVVPELSALSDTAWYVFDTISGGVKPFILQRRKALNLVQRTAETDDPVFDRNVIQMGMDLRVGAGYGIWARAFKGVA